MRNTEKSPIEQKIARTEAKGWGLRQLGSEPGGRILGGLGSEGEFWEGSVPEQSWPRAETPGKAPRSALGCDIHGNLPGERPGKCGWGRRGGA